MKLNEKTKITMDALNSGERTYENLIMRFLAGSGKAAKRLWSAQKVRQVCIENDLYTCGDNEEYSNMLDCVRDCYPDTENLYLIAMDICKHSKGQTITNIMYLLENEAVITTFEIDGDDNT